MKSLLAISVWKTNRFDCRIEALFAPPSNQSASSSKRPFLSAASSELTIIRPIAKHPQPLFRPSFHSFPDARFPYRRHLFIALKHSLGGPERLAGS
jgi:hypothetical protein